MAVAKPTNATRPTLEQARAALALHPLPDSPWLRVTDEAVLILAGYNEALQRMLRWVPQARWRADLRAWWVPLTGAELVRSVLPEISRLAEAMHEEAGTRRVPAAVAGPPPQADDEDGARRRFRDGARLLYGSDWLRETAQALGRDEPALARWLVGEAVAEAPPAQLLAELLTLMQRRAAEIETAAAALAAAMTTRESADRP